MEAVRSFDGTALRRLRKARGMSHDALASLTSTARPNLIAYEKGTRTPSPAKLGVLARALEVDPLDLMGVTPATATLAQLRARIGLSRSEVAAELGISRKSYDSIERGGARLRPNVGSELAALLRLSKDEVDAARRREADGQAQASPAEPGVR